MKNIKAQQNIMNKMKNINYGWIDKEHTKHILVDDSFSDNYILESPEEVLINKVGVCWDQVELERFLFEKSNIEVKTFFIVHYDGNKCPTHTFLTFNKDNKTYWFEHAWEKFRGIHEYESLKELLIDVRNKFIKIELNNNYQKNNLVLYEYTKPTSHLSVIEYYKHCESGLMIDVDNL